ncbi:MAG: IPT/TIG domain-containing protein [Planctomycetota bacterium]|nr:IPT/TIG domain-containing protein [Planctomycetota bacterium]
MSLRRTTLGVLVALAVASTVAAHVRLTHPSNGNPLRWASPGAIAITVNATGSDDIPDGSHLPAIQLAIRAWNDATGTTATLVENTSPGSRARSDWEADDLHTVIFDEDDSSGYFPNGTGIVALTPVWFNTSGVISDADVLFNGSDFTFTTEGVVNAFDVQDVATHEIGHLLGLDHSGWAGATMYPYVDPTVILHRSLAGDDERGLRDAYPTGTYSTIAGRVTRASDGGAVAGANVAALDADGRTIAGALADNSGNYALKGLEAGTYTVWASPLDQPVAAGNLGGGHTVVTTFQSTAIASATVGGSGTTNVGNGTAGVGADAAFALGRNTDELPLRIEPGGSGIYSLHGTGLAAGSTLAASDPDFTVVVIAWNNTVVTFQATAAPGEPMGHVDLRATSPSGDRSVLHAALEVAAVDPFVIGVSPTSGTLSGGTFVTITGAEFRAGARVILANQVYVDGDIGGCTVVDDSTITLTTRASAAGVWDVVVQDRTGSEARAGSGFTFAALPQIASAFPVSGWSGGGTLVRLRGTDFVAGTTVRIDGNLQSGVTVASATSLSFSTSAGLPGGPYVLEIETPGGATASTAFSYQADPDPAVIALDPPSGTTSGGQIVTVTGANFTADAEVVFGADAETGLGGTGADVVFLDANTLQVTTPAMSAGTTNVLVRLALTDQATVATAAFTFQSPSTGGGGGCSIAPIEGPRGPFDGFTAFLPILLALVWLAIGARRPVPVRVRVR